LQIRLKRVYEGPSSQDGKRVLADRLWPRGLKKEEARVDLWLREIAPSTELRKWFGHDPDKWQEFKRRYFRELDCNHSAVQELLALADKGRVTLVFGARDKQFNHAVALKEYIQNYQ
jgi:uncharacterized protein YeaO (DUF488 family)